ncbi:LysE family translocator [Vibrio viridaestus]|uniref:Transporter n=1 Tax=Vibrio viridaestus TaxID=2487322 RepID=A0A3N9TLF8_9VIBR|nr:LysE family transporter [Vibrio viridaestus]RQW64713.1 transporter [Vibrio viridaestus]
MLAILAYALGIMYSPGPVNLLGLRCGILGKTKAHVGFFAGVGCAMFILFMCLSFVGRLITTLNILPFMSLIGSSYILYIAYKIAKSRVNISEESNEHSLKDLSFFDGLWMQLFNPKGMIATLPIATIQFPAAGIEGHLIPLWSMLLAILAFGAPGSYAIAGQIIGNRIHQQHWFSLFNYAMSTILLIVAVDIGYYYGIVPLL